jgi:hypothetical protein
MVLNKEKSTIVGILLVRRVSITGILFFILGLFNDTFNISNYIVSFDGMNMKSK